MPRCRACNSDVDYGVEFCYTCRVVIHEYNSDLDGTDDDEELDYYGISEEKEEDS